MKDLTIGMALRAVQMSAIFGGFLLCLRMASAQGRFSSGGNRNTSFQFSSLLNLSKRNAWISPTSSVFHRRNPQPGRNGRFVLNPTRLLLNPHNILGIYRTLSWSPNLVHNPLEVSNGFNSQQHPTENSIYTEDYFRCAQDIPMKLYNTVVCAVFKKSSNQQKVDCQSHSSEKVWKKFVDDIGKIPCRHQFELYRDFNERYSQFALRKVKGILYGGAEPPEEHILKQSLLNRLNSKDLELIFEHVFGPTTMFGKTAKTQLGLFYVANRHSTIDRLAGEDMKRLNVDLILAANRKLTCPSCGTIFYTADQVVEAVSERLLPQRLPREKKGRALNAIKFISEAKLTSTKVSQLLGNLVKSHQEGSLDVAMTCKVLRQAKATSYYCGVRESACQLYNKLNCASRMNGQIDEDDDDKDSRSDDDYYSKNSDDGRNVSDDNDDSDGNDKHSHSGSMDHFDRNYHGRTTIQTTTTRKTATTTTTTTTTTAATTTAPRRRPSIPAPQCGVSDTASRMFSVQTAGLLTEARIVGGFVVGTCTTYPWMVRILIPSTGNICGGAILDERHVLTAAHCLLFTDKIRVFVGDYDRANVEGTEQIIDTAIQETNNKALHPDYNYGRQVNDIAVVTLDTPIDLDRICATPLCLDPDFQIKTGMKCVTAGWGLTNENGRTGSELMRAASIPTFDSPDCLRLFPDIYMSDPARQICAGEPDVGGVDTCGGDSGSPLFCLDDISGRWVAVGVVNYGEGCARAGYAGVYADIRKYIPWIISRMAD